MEPKSSCDPSILLREGRLTEAKEYFEKALAVAPKDSRALSNLGAVHRELGNIDSAISFFDQALEIQPDKHWIHSNKLLTQNYCPKTGLDELEKCHTDWGGSLKGVADFEGKKRLGDRIHIGLFSPDIRWHSVVFFLMSWLPKIDRDKFEISVFSDVQNPDQMTSLVRDLGISWVDVSDFDDDRLLKAARLSRLDVAFDLAGHTAYNRMEAFARRLAPVQVSWIGYPMCTGNPSMDYWLTEPELNLGGFGKGSNANFRSGVHVYHPPVPSSFSNSGEVDDSDTVFGCFNHRAKINRRVIEAWSEILHAVKDSKLVLKNRAMLDNAARLELLEAFVSAGIDRNRIELIGRLPTTIDHLTLYRRIDIALDTFPYNGTTTTFEALWMGVPVVTCKGKTPAGRMGESILGRLDRADWIAENCEEYVRVASNLGASKKGLETFRKESRVKMVEHGLTDGTGFVSEFEAWLSNIVV